MTSGSTANEISPLSWRRNRAFRPVMAIADQGVSSATTFLCSAIIARSTSKEEFGFYVLGLTVLGWFIGLQSAAITSPYMYRQAELSATLRLRLRGSTLVHQLILAGLATAGIAVGVIAVGRLAPFGYESAAQALSLCLAAVMLKEYGRQLSFAHHLPQEALVLDTAVLVLQVGGFAWLALSGSASSASAYIVTGLSCGVAAVTWITVQRRSFQPHSSDIAPDLRNNWSFGKWLFIGFAVNALAKDMYGWVLTAFHGTAAAGVLATCLGIVMLSSPIVIGVSNHLGPNYARLLTEEGHARLLESVRRGTRLAVVFVILLVGGVALFGNWGVGLIYGPRYLGNGLVLVALAISLGASIVTMPVGVALLALQRADLTFRAICVGAVGTIVVGVSCARLYGPLGAALGLLSANVLESTAKVILFRRHWMKNVVVDIETS